MKTVNSVQVAIVGCGGISRVHAEAWQDIEQIELIAACDTNVESLKTFVEQYRVADSYLDLRTMLENHTPDVLVITTWPSSHLKNLLETVRGRVKKLLCEKPLAVNAKQIEQMIQITDNSQTLLTEAFMYRHHPVTQTVKQKISAGEIGDLRSVNAVFPTGLTDYTNWRLRGDLGGGTMMDLGCYCVDLIGYLTDIPPVCGFGTGKYAHGVNVWETMYATIRYNENVVAQIDTGFGMIWREFYEIVGTKGSIKVEPAWGHNVGECQFILNGEPIAVKGVNPYAAEMLNLCQADSQDDLVVPLKDSLRNMRLIDALHESAHSGKVVRL